MNAIKTIAIALIALTSATVALADDPSVVAPEPTTSVVTRAEVRQALSQARAAGQVIYGEGDFVAAPTGMALTRAQVKAEAREALRIGAVQRGEASFVITPMQLELIRMAGLKALSMTTAGL